MKSREIFRTVVGSPYFTVSVVLLFVFLAGRTAFTRVFPLPYDEGFHFGLIQLYTHHLSPFLASQPAGGDAYGAVARDGSYLYHYLFSFPLRVIDLFTSNQLTQVIILRVLNIGLGLATLGLMYKFCRRLKLTRVTTNLMVLAFAATPVFYDLSGQINYDNLLIPLTLLSLLMAWNIRNQVLRYQIKTASVLRLLSLMLVASLVKYTYLPILVGIVLYLTVTVVRTYGFRDSARTLVADFVKLSGVAQIAAVTCLIVASGLWIQRYGVDMAKYHTPHPQCGAVLSVESCSNYAPWARNYALSQQSTKQASHAGLGIVGFTKYWTRSMYIQLYSTVHNSDGAVTFTILQPLRLAFKLFLVLGIAAMIIYFQRFFRSSIPWGLLGAPLALYLLALWAQNFSDFHHLGTYVAIQGRYLLPVLAITYACLGRACQVAYGARPLARLGVRLRAGMTEGTTIFSLLRKWAQR